ncbi:MAG: PKD domain-containing protein [Tannerellaceae bacterium]|nr:PKD domain-containing protein [Tannerellaceae bacterium]
MDKLLNAKTLIIIAIFIICIAAFSALHRSCAPARTINAYISPIDVELGESVRFADSTRYASKWLWEFGNGDFTELQSGEYFFTATGKYQVRLTVNNTMEKRFLINVKAASQANDNPLVRITAPSVAMQEELVVFKGVGNDTEWRWEFGETGMVDAREKTALYSYRNPGVYDVMLTTENTRYPVIHQIEVLPKYMENDSTDMLTLIGMDIREKLQHIANGQPFNTNYNYILKKYLCGNPDAIVMVNNNKYNDFYSYCHGLRLIGRDVTTIDQVVVETRSETDDCIHKLMVLQSEKIR